MAILVRNSCVYKLVQLVLSGGVAFLILLPKSPVSSKNVFCSRIGDVDCFSPMLFPLFLAFLTAASIVSHLLATVRGRTFITADWVGSTLAFALSYGAAMVIFNVVSDEWEQSSFNKDMFPETWHAAVCLIVVLSVFQAYEALIICAFPDHYYRLIYPKPVRKR